MKRLRGAAQKKPCSVNWLTLGLLPKSSFSQRKYWMSRLHTLKRNLFMQQSPYIVGIEGFALFLCALVGVLLGFASSYALIYTALFLMAFAIILFAVTRKQKNTGTPRGLDYASYIGLFVTLAALMYGAATASAGHFYFVGCYLLSMLLGSMVVPPWYALVLAGTLLIQTAASIATWHLGTVTMPQLLGLWAAATCTQAVSYVVYRYRLGLYMLGESVRSRGKQLKNALSTIRSTSKALAEKDSELERRTRRMQLANKQLEELAVIDALTGLYNRRGLDVWLAEAWRMCASESKPISIAMIDIDRFKPYNDHFGHVKGDECLRQVAVSLKSTVQRGSDIVARYGGEEFLMLLPRTDHSGAMRVAEAARVDVQNLCLPRENDSIYPVVTVSIGVATAVPGQGDSTVTKLIMAADAAMYKAKQSGRNRVLGFENISDADFEGRMG